MTNKPNIIVFFTDQQRWDTSGLHGNPLSLMDNFDRGAQEGTHIFNSFSCQPVCGPARASFQTGFRNPTTQDQYIGLNAGRAYLIGSAPDNLDRFNTPALPFSPTGTALTGLASREVSGREAYENAFSLTSVLGGAPTAANVELVKAERVSAYEIGYRGLVGSDESRITVDLSVYYNQYQDFIAGKNVRMTINTF